MTTTKPLIGIAGRRRAGKDTLGRYLALKHDYTTVALADKVKEGVLALNPYIPRDNLIDDPALKGGRHLAGMYADTPDWDILRENPEVRRLWQYFGTEVGQAIFGTLFWCKLVEPAMLERMANGQPTVITDCRFVHEAGWVRSHGGVIIKVVRNPGHQLPADLHRSEVQVDLVTPDYTIRNNSTIENLYAQLDDVMADIVFYRTGGHD